VLGIVYALLAERLCDSRREGKCIDPAQTTVGAEEDRARSWIGKHRSCPCFGPTRLGDNWQGWLSLLSTMATTLSTFARMHLCCGSCVGFGALVGRARSVGRVAARPPRRPHLHRHGWLGAAQADAELGEHNTAGIFMSSIWPVHKSSLRPREGKLNEKRVQHASIQSRGGW